jgi:4-hydroxy-3-methylbut-2-enyl diphosphate reductase
VPSTSENTVAGPSRVLLAAPRGYCAGVDRAVQTVEHALDLYGEPIYVRKEIVHNKHVVQQLEKRGAIFVEEETEVPEGQMVVFSAHGVAPSVHANSEKRNLRTIDATCPLVTKVHVEARKFAADGYTIVLVGHDGHEEVEGTTGGASEHRPRRDRGGRRQPGGGRSRSDRVHHPDHPLGRRDRLDHRPPEGEVPERGGAEDR